MSSHHDSVSSRNIEKPGRQGVPFHADRQRPHGFPSVGERDAVDFERDSGNVGRADASENGIESKIGAVRDRGQCVAVVSNLVDHDAVAGVNRHHAVAHCDARAALVPVLEFRLRIHTDTGTRGTAALGPEPTGNTTLGRPR